MIGFCIGFAYAWISEMYKERYSVKLTSQQQLDLMIKKYSKKK